MPDIALDAMPPVWRTDIASRSHQIRSACIGSRPTISSAIRSTIAATGRGEPQSVQSPHPTVPSLVSILTNVHGRNPPSTMNVRTPVIFNTLVPFLALLESKTLENGPAKDAKRRKRGEILF